MNPQPTTYEFSEDQNLVFKTLATRMRLFGTTAILTGVLVVLGALWMVKRIEEPWALFTGVVLSALYFFVLGGPTFSASKDFLRIVETSNNDVNLLMDAVQRLQKVFFFNVLFVIGLVVVQLLAPRFTLPG